MSIKSSLIVSFPYICNSVRNKLEKPVLAKTPDSPRLFNEHGEEMIWMYLDDSRCRHHPYTLNDGCYPRRIIWDRYNQALPLHMYNHMAILNHKPSDNIRQFGILKEAEIITPNDYEVMLRQEERIKSLAAIFTFSERMLDKYENAYFSLCNGLWYGTEKWGGMMDINNYQKKTKLLSIVASAKKFVPLHVFRADVARELKRRGLADAMGTSVGNYFDKISDAFDDYMYNVAIENESTKYYFTEKILDCFASMTIPVYYGAIEIDKFFNPDGIIKIKEPTIECVVETIKQCSRNDYESRLDAMKDNFNRVKKYRSVDDYLSDNYWDLFTK